MLDDATPPPILTARSPLLVVPLDEDGAPILTAGSNALLTRLDDDGVPDRAGPIRFHVPPPPTPRLSFVRITPLDEDGAPDPDRAVTFHLAGRVGLVIGSPPYTYDDLAAGRDHTPNAHLLSSREVAPDEPQPTDLARYIRAHPNTVACVEIWRTASGDRWVYEIAPRCRPTEWILPPDTTPADEPHT